MKVKTRLAGTCGDGSLWGQATADGQPIEVVLRWSNMLRTRTMVIYAWTG